MQLPINWLNILKAPVGGFSAEYQAVYDSFTTKPSAAVAAAQNTMVEALVDAGVWAKRDAFVVLAQESNGDGEALTNWINPGTYDGTLVNAPTFTSLEGFGPLNGSSQYINTNFVPSVGVNKYLQDSANLMSYIRNDVAETAYDFGAFDGTLLAQVIGRNSSDNITMALNGGQSTSANILGDGIFEWNRSGAATLEAYRNASLIFSPTDASTGLVTLSLYIGARHNAGAPSSFSTRQYSVYGIGGSLTGPEVTAEKNAIETYMDSNGKGVIT